MSFGKRGADLTQHGVHILKRQMGPNAGLAYAGAINSQNTVIEEDSGVNLLFYTAMYFVYNIIVSILLYLFLAVLAGGIKILEILEFNDIVTKVIVLLLVLGGYFVGFAASLFGGVLATSYHFLVRHGRLFRDNERKLLVGLIILTSLLLLMIAIMLLFFLDPAFGMYWQQLLSGKGSVEIAGLVIGGFVGFAFTIWLAWLVLNLGFGWLARKVFATKLASVY